MINGEQIANVASLTQDLDYLPLNLVLPEDKKAMDQTFFFKSQQNGKSAKRKTETQGGLSSKECMMEKTAERGAGMEPDRLPPA